MQFSVQKSNLSQTFVFVFVFLPFNYGTEFTTPGATWLVWIIFIICSSIGSFKQKQKFFGKLVLHFKETFQRMCFQTLMDWGLTLSWQWSSAGLCSCWKPLRSSTYSRHTGMRCLLSSAQQIKSSFNVNGPLKFNVYFFFLHRLGYE